jgi:hypothetical protein
MLYDFNTVPLNTELYIYHLEFNSTHMTFALKCEPTKGIVKGDGRYICNNV